MGVTVQLARWGASRILKDLLPALCALQEHFRQFSMQASVTIALHTRAPNREARAWLNACAMWAIQDPTGGRV